MIRVFGWSDREQTDGRYLYEGEDADQAVDVYAGATSPPWAAVELKIDEHYPPLFYRRLEKGSRHGKT